MDTSTTREPRSIHRSVHTQGWWHCHSRGTEGTLLALTLAVAIITTSCASDILTASSSQPHTQLRPDWSCYWFDPDSEQLRTNGNVRHAIGSSTDRRIPWAWHTDRLA